jgi:hypothetical protein
MPESALLLLDRFTQSMHPDAGALGETRPGRTMTMQKASGARRGDFRPGRGSFQLHLKMIEGSHKL